MFNVRRFTAATWLLCAACCLVTPAPGAGVLPVAEFALPDASGKQHSLGDLIDKQLVVVAFLGTECPLAKLYAPRLQALAEEYAPSGVGFLAIDSNSQDSTAEIAAFAKQHGLAFPLLKDQDNEAADLFGATRTPEVFVLDRRRVVRYQGRIDDQYVVGIARDQATREDLRAALEELLADRPVTQPVTKALGCLIGRAREADEASGVTYARDIAPIFQARCVECHREGEIGPFPLRTHEQAAGWGEMITEVIREGRMPPWHANPAHGSFANERVMPESEKRLVYQWVDSGCPEGDPNDLPPAPTYTSGWQLPRTPDAIVPMAETPYAVPAEGGPAGVPYQYFRAPSGFTEDRWVEAAEVQPGNRSVVHHIIVYAQPPGGKGRQDWIMLTAYVPGLRFDALPEGSAKLIPAGSDFIFEMHYTPVGSPQEDTSRLGLLFADDGDVRQEVVTTEVGNTRFEIPPHAAAHVVTATSRPIDRPMTLLSLSPHMHLRGKAFRYELATPDGRREVLLDVPAYDFNWQTRYVLAEPMPLPAGAVIHCRAVFDNSAENLANPDPSKAIRWGDQSWDEMMLGYFDLLLPREASRRPGAKPLSTGLDVVGLFDKADADKDGGLTREEASGLDLLAKHFEKLDANGDEQLQLAEVLAALRLMAGG